MVAVKYSFELFRKKKIAETGKTKELREYSNVIAKPLKVTF
jgi:hypothetical protein